MNDAGRPVKPHRSGGGDVVEPFPLPLPNGEMPQHPAQAPAPANPAGMQIVTLDPVTYVASVYAAFVDRLAAAKATVADIKIVDVSTKEGMALAIKHRATFRSIRIEAENARVFRKAPVLTIGRLLDSRNNELAAEIFAEENRFDKAINADRDRKIAEAEAKAKAEADRIAAEEAARKEAEAKVLAAQRAEIERQQAEVAERERALLQATQKMRDDTERRDREAREKIEAEQRAARKEREEADRKAQAERDRIDAEAKAKRDAEEARIKAEQAAEAKRLREAEEKIAAERRAVEDSARKEREAQEERERVARVAEEARLREIARKENELLDARAILNVFAERYGAIAEFAAIVKAISAYMKGKA